MFSRSPECLRMASARPPAKFRPGAVPNWLLRVVALFDPQVRGVLPELGKRKNATNEKARRLLGWAPRSPKEAALATARSLSELGLLKAG